MGEPEALASFAMGDLEVDFVHRLVRSRGETVQLTPTEYELLEVMIRRAETVVNRLARQSERCGAAATTRTRCTCCA